MLLTTLHQPPSGQVASSMRLLVSNIQCSCKQTMRGSVKDFVLDSLPREAGSVYKKSPLSPSLPVNQHPFGPLSYSTTVTYCTIESGSMHRRIKANNSQPIQLRKMLLPEQLNKLEEFLCNHNTSFYGQCLLLNMGYI